MRKIKYYLLLFLWVGLLLSPICTQAQKFEKYFIKFEADYNKGEYKKAAKTIEKTKTKSIKKLGNNNQYEAYATILEAKINLALGKLYGFEAKLESGLIISAAANGVESTDHGLNFMDAAEIMLDYGNLIKADELLEGSKKILEANGELKGTLLARYQLNKAAILSGRGFYTAALKLMEEQYEFFASRAVKKESYVDNGQLKTRKVPKEEIDLRFGEFARIQSLKAYTLHKKGDFRASDAAFQKADTWIDKNLGRSSDSWANNQYLWALMLEENGVTPKIRAKYYEKASVAMRAKYKPYHILNLRIQQKLIRAYADNKNGSKLNREETEYNKMTKGYFGTQSVHFLMRNALKLDLKLSKDKTKGVEKQAFDIINNRSILPDIHPDRIRFLEFLADFYSVEGNYAAASDMLATALEIKKALYGDDSPEFALSQLKMANHIINFGDDLKGAEAMYGTYYDNMLKDEILFGHVEYLDIQNNLATLYHSTDRYDEAYEALQRAKDAAQGKYSNTDIEYAIALDGIARLLIKIGRYSEAIAANTQSIGIFDELKGKDKNAAFAGAWETRAILNAAYGAFDDAQVAFDRSSRLQGKSSVTGKLESSTNIEEVASLYLEMGKFKETENLLEKAIARYEASFGMETRKLIKPLTEKSRLQLTSGDYPAAQRTAQRAYEISQKVYGPGSTKTAVVRIQLGDVFTALGDYEQADENLREGLKVQRAQFGDEHVDVAVTNTKLALVAYYEDKAIGLIEDMLSESRDIFAKKLGRQNPRYAESLEYLANAYIKDSRNDEAFELLEQARKIWEARLGRRNNIKLAGIHESKGDIYYFRRNFDEANDEYNQARKLYRRAFSQEHPNYVKILTKLSKVAYMQGEAKATKDYIDEAIATYKIYIQKYFPALSEREKAKFWNTIRPDFEYFNTLAVRLQYSDPEVLQDMYDNALVTKSLLLNSSIKMRQQILSSGDEELIKQYTDWLVKKEQMTAVISMSQEQQEENGINAEALEKEIEQLEKELGTKSALFGQSFEENALSWRDVQASLRENEVAIEMVRFRYFDHTFNNDSILYAMLYIKGEKRSVPEVILLTNGKDLEHKYKNYYRNTIKFRQEDYFSHDVYWKPIADKVGSYSTIYLSADGVYNQINLETIPLGDGRYVLDNSNIILLNNTKDIYHKRKQAAGSTEPASNYAIMYGNPKYYLSKEERTVAAELRSAGFTTTVAELPGTQKEIEQLRNLFTVNGWKVEDYLQVVAQEDSIKEMVSPRVFHIATHGFFTPTEEFQERAGLKAAAEFSNPLLRCGLMLTGAGDLLDQTAYNYNLQPGILTAYEAMNLNLDATDLVILSACETGLGDVQIGEGVFGLQRAFLVAGAKTLVMSLFKVSDEATQKLMVKFYEKWFKTGDMRQSFIDAKKEIRNEYKDPLFWGSFIMMGME